MLVTMDMSSVKTDGDYTSEVMCAGWNPEIAQLQGRAAELAAQLIFFQSQRAGGMPVDVVTKDVEIFLARMYASQR